MTEHTPGPWQALFDENGTWARVDGDMKNGGAYVVAEFDLMQASHHGEKAWLEEKANARLIAAAPDLLAALEEADAILDCLVDEDWYRLNLPPQREQRTRRKAAIAKARGQS